MTLPSEASYQGKAGDQQRRCRSLPVTRAQQAEGQEWKPAVGKADESNTLHIVLHVVPYLNALIHLKLYELVVESITYSLIMMLSPGQYNMAVACESPEFEIQQSPAPPSWRRSYNIIMM